MSRTSSPASPCAKMLSPRAYFTLVFATPEESRNASTSNGGAIARRRLVLPSAMRPRMTRGHVRDLYTKAQSRSLIVQHDGEQRVVDLEPVAVIDESESLEFLHEEID